jgi:carbonic anhydrase/acetyltransferase-like protein (isoleucine patch superfamily)
VIYSYKDNIPSIHSSAYLAEGVRIIGDVEISEQCSIWFNSVLRGDLAPIRIGKRSNIQDGTIGHVNLDQPLLVGEDVSVGHQAIIHGCQIGKGSLIGMGAILLNGASVGEYVLVGAGALIPENKIIPPYTLVLGTPGRIVRELTEDDLDRMKRTTEGYVQKGLEYMTSSGLVRRVEPL